MLLGLELTATRRKFDLDHMRVLARALGDPQKRFKSVLIAGTNGKGSTAATLASILAAAGLRTGLYTSPHLTRVTERIRATNVLRVLRWTVDRSETEAAATDNGPTEIPEEAFARLYFQVDDAARVLVASGELPHHPSFFETLTALAFLYFAEIEVDIAVLEVGLGGRLDATNIAWSRCSSVITDIALDHQDYLGSTIPRDRPRKSRHPAPQRYADYAAAASAGEPGHRRSRRRPQRPRHQRRRLSAGSYRHRFRCPMSDSFIV